MNNRMWIISRILLMVVVLVLCYLSCGIERVRPQTVIEGWKLEFWQIRPVVGDYLTVNKGDTLSISWIQELKSIPKDKQESFGIGDTLGAANKVTLYLNRDAVRAIKSGNQFNCKVVRSINLDIGMWALVMYTKGNGGLWSKHSRPFWFRVEGAPPTMPVEIKLWIR